MIIGGHRHEFTALLAIGVETGGLETKNAGATGKGLWPAAI